MKKTAIFLLMLTLPLSAENLFSNSTMDTAGGWKGTKRVVKETEDGKENRLIQLKASPRDTVSFNQEVDTRNIKDVIVKFRYRSQDYKGRGLEFRGKRLDQGSTFFTQAIKADGQWHQAEFKFTQVNGSNKIDFFFILLEGEGEVSFDDITAEGK